jgi:DNA modification methylase
VGFRKEGGSKKVTSPDKLGQMYKIPDSVIRVPRNSVMGGQHPAAFAVGLPVELIEAYSNTNELIYEPFSGSGTTIITAEQTNRTAYAMEISPIYVDVAVQRWEKFTGQKAELICDG